MTLVQKTDHVSEALGNLIERFKDKPKFAAFITALVTQVQALETANFQLLEDRDIDNAVGVQLDGLGSVVGEGRLGRDDESYRLAIRVRIKLNLCEGVPEQIIEILSLATSGRTIHIQNLSHGAEVLIDGDMEASGVTDWTPTADGSEFEFTIDTAQAGSANDTFVLPLPGTGTYDYYVDWGEGAAPDHYTVNTDQTHVYASSGTYTIKIAGTFPRIYFNNVGDKAKLITVVSLGSIAWNNFDRSFYGCSGLTSFVDGSDVDTSAVTSLFLMFSGCTSLTTLDVSGFDTSNVTTMNSTFRSCSALTVLDISGFDTSKVINIGNLFYNCSSVTTLAVSGWDVSKVTNMGYAFRNCAALTVLDLSGWDTSSATSMAYMFYLCSALTILDVSGWDTQKVTSMNNMFRNCSSVTVLDPSDFSILALTDATDMLNGSSFATTEYDLLLVAWEGQSHNNSVVFHAGTAQFDGGAPAAARCALAIDDSWTITDGGVVDEFEFTVDTTQAGSANDTFVLPLPSTGTYDYCVDWGEGGAIEHFTTNTDQTHVYASSGTYTIKIAGTFPRIYFNNSGDKAKLLTVVSMGNIAWGDLNLAYYGCTNLTSFVAGSNVDTTSTTTVRSMFNGCTSLVTLNLAGFDTSSVTDMGYLLISCAALTTLNLSSFVTSSVVNMSYMFRNCSSLTVLDVSGFDTSLATTFKSMFQGCSSVTTLDPSGFDIGALTDAANMLLSSSFATAEYDLLLVAWEGQSHNNSVVFHAGSAKYNAGAPATARGVLATTDSWTITDGGAV